MKRRFVAGGLALLFFLWLSLAFASNFGLLLTGRSTDCTLRLTRMMELLSDPRGRRLFFLLVLASILLVLWMLFGHSYLKYKSDMYEVVPGFRIPRPAGQGQHGTAWFMPPKKFAVCFAMAAAEETLPLPPELAKRYQEERRDMYAADNKTG